MAIIILNNYIYKYSFFVIICSSIISMKIISSIISMTIISYV
jgi:hypothetical protein